MTESAKPNDPLAKIALLASVDGAERIQLGRESAYKVYAPHETIFDKDSTESDIMFVLKGCLTITSYSLSGKEISFDEVSEGDYFGELSAVDQEPRSATVVANTKSEIASLSATRFRKLMDDYPAISAAVMTRFTTIIRQSNERIIDLATLNAQQRVCAEILKLSKPDAGTPGAWCVYPLPTQNAIASRIGTSRETVGRVMSDLMNGDLVVKKGRSLFIPDREKLETLTERLQTGSGD